MHFGRGAEKNLKRDFMPKRDHSVYLLAPVMFNFKCTFSVRFCLYCILLLLVLLLLWNYFAIFASIVHNWHGMEGRERGRAMEKPSTAYSTGDWWINVSYIMYEVVPMLIVNIMKCTPIRMFGFLELFNMHITKWEFPHPMIRHHSCIISIWFFHFFFLSSMHTPSMIDFNRKEALLLRSNECITSEKYEYRKYIHTYYTQTTVLKSIECG